jgi:hypothetical protein
MIQYSAGLIKRRRQGVPDARWSLSSGSLKRDPLAGMTARTYGVATASEACAATSATQAFLRCKPLIAPVTLSTFPAGQEASWTKAISYGARI